MNSPFIISPFFDKYSLPLVTICTYTVDKENGALMLVDVTT